MPLTLMFLIAGIFFVSMGCVGLSSSVLFSLPEALLFSVMKSSVTSAVASAARGKHGGQESKVVELGYD